MTRGVAVTGKRVASQIEGATVSKQQWWGWKAKWRDVVMAAGYKDCKGLNKEKEKGKTSECGIGADGSDCILPL